MNGNASNSHAWGTISLADLYAEVVAEPQEFELPPAESGSSADLAA